MRKHKALIMSVLFLLLGCQPPGPPTSNGMPAAVTPVLIILFAEVPAPVAGPSPSWVPTPFIAPAPFKIMPLRSSSSSNIKLLLDVPYPSTLAITGTDPATGTITTFAQVPSGQPGPSTAFFTVDAIDVNKVPARWTVSMRLPPQPFSAYTVSITDVSGNPVYTGAAHESAALVLPLVPSFARFTIKVMITGVGHVTSNPGGISCNQNNGTCAYYFFGATQQPIRLDPGSFNQSKFLGWTGSCIGTGSCYLAQTGLEDFAVEATFVPLGDSSTTLNQCAAAPAVAGWTWKSVPTCGGLTHSNTKDNTTHCDSQGYFCCDTPGTGSPGCASDEHRAPPDCGIGTEAGTHLRLFQPGGCYESD